MSLQPPEKVQKLQEVLHTKAKEAPSYRFYALYDKLYRWDVLLHAYERCLENQGAPGVDGQTFEDIAAYGLGKWLDELANWRLRQWMGRKNGKRVWASRCPDKYLHATLGLIDRAQFRKAHLIRVRTCGS